MQLTDLPEGLVEFVARHEARRSTAINASPDLSKKAAVTLSGPRVENGSEIKFRCSPDTKDNAATGAGFYQMIKIVGKIEVLLIRTKAAETDI